MNAEATSTSTELTVVQRAQVALQSGENEKKLRELAATSKSITTITNKAGYDQCHSSRMALKRMRLDIEAIGKGAREDAQKFSTAVIAEQKRLVSLIEPEEKRLQVLQEAWDAERERERQAKLEAEARRVAAIQERIEQIRDQVGQAVGESAEVIKSRIQTLVSMEIGEDFAEFKKQAEGARETTLIRLRSAEAKQIAVEEEQRQLAAERERLAREREEQERLQAAERARIAEEERLARIAREAEELRAREAREAEERRQREEAELNQGRLSEIQGIQQQVMIAVCGRLGVRKGGTRDCIVETLEETRKWPITEERFGPVFFGTAQKIKADVLTQIEQLLTQWDERAESDRITAEARKAEEERLEVERVRQQEEADRLQSQRKEAERAEAARLAAIEAEEKRLAEERAQLEADRARQAEEQRMREAGGGAPAGATASESGDSNIVNAPTEPATESSASSTSDPEATSPQGGLIDPLADLSVEELRALLLEAIPYLRQAAHQCEACGGGGEIQIDDDRVAECKHCKPIWDLVQKIEPRRAPPAPAAVATLEYCDKTANCILAKGHEGDCDDDIPF